MSSQMPNSYYRPDNISADESRACVSLSSLPRRGKRQFARTGSKFAGTGSEYRNFQPSHLPSQRTARRSRSCWEASARFELALRTPPTGWHRHEAELATLPRSRGPHPPVSTHSSDARSHAPDQSLFAPYERNQNSAPAFTQHSYIPLSRTRLPDRFYADFFLFSSSRTSSNSASTTPSPPSLCSLAPPD
jgi:hypothetical protein